MAWRFWLLAAPGTFNREVQHVFGRVAPTYSRMSRALRLKVAVPDPMRVVNTRLSAGRPSMGAMDDGMMIDTTGQDAHASHEVVKAPMDKDADRIAATVAMFFCQYKLKAGPESTALIPPGRAKKPATGTSKAKTDAAKPSSASERACARRFKG